jgi:hypothetical protein
VALQNVTLDLSYASSMGEEVDAHLLAAAEYGRLSHPKWLGPPGFITNTVMPILGFLPLVALSLCGRSLSPLVDGYATALLTFGWMLPIVLAPTVIHWRRQAAMRRRLAGIRPELRFGTVPTELCLRPDAVEVASLGRRQHWPPFSCLSLIETAALFVLLLDEAVVPIPKRALDWPERSDFLDWAAGAGLTPRYVPPPPRNGAIIAASAVLLLATAIVLCVFTVRFGSGG